ncbi:hypothetical protein BDFB_014965 [Asbolus verrucosus]|uniref:Uncharacterized protein n=1 Tax=Asbolus verrucosus TaxID=1661398 RepID=A0A482VZ83_ASBVE|nr:hypothetical protein BDFB_014965 [Asbolus verrucosus]
MKTKNASSMLFLIAIIKQLLPDTLRYRSILYAEF